MREVLAHGSSSPPLFNLAVVACVRVIDDPELSAELVPFVASLLTIVATAAASWRLTGRTPCAVIAAALVACDPVAIVYAARVKQYSTDGLVTALHLIALHEVATRRSSRALLGYAAFGSAGVLLSSSSSFVAATFFPAALYEVRRREAPPGRLLLASAWIVAAALAALAWSWPNQALREFWAGHYLPASPVGFATGLARALARWVASPLQGVGPDDVPRPAAAWIGAGLVALGTVTLASSPASCRVLAPSAALVGALALASACRRFPLGTGRVELFLLPLVALWLAAGLDLDLPPRLRRLSLALVAGVLALVLPSARQPRYPARAHRAARGADRARAHRR